MASPSRPTNKHSGRTALLPLGMAVQHDEQAHSPHQLIHRPPVPALQQRTQGFRLDDVHQLAVDPPASHQPAASIVSYDGVHQVAVATSTSQIGQERIRSNSVLDINQGPDGYNPPASQHKSCTTSSSYPAVSEAVGSTNSHQNSKL